MKLRRLLLLGFAGYVTYAIADQIHWGYWEVRGDDAAADLIDNREAEDRRKLATEVCGEPTDYDRVKHIGYMAAMPEQQVVKRFFKVSKFENVIWVGMGRPDRFCLARYQVREWDTGFFIPWITNLLPYPRIYWDSHWNWEQRLIERITQKPVAPAGVQALFPGECAAGELAKGETRQYQVVVPSFGQKVELLWFYDGSSNLAADCEVIKDGRRLTRHAGDWTAGTYRVTVRAPATEAKHFMMAIYWGVRGCARPEGWFDRYD